MALKTTGEVVVGVDRQTAFEFVRDAERLATCIPGCREVREVSPGRYEATLSARVAVSLLEFKVQIETVKIDPPHSIDAVITGDAIGLSGRVSATAGVQLEDTGPRETLVRYVSDVALTGKLGSMGQPVFRATSVLLSRQFAQNLKAALEGLR